jgi:hypothetical protein
MFTVQPKTLLFCCMFPAIVRSRDAYLYKEDYKCYLLRNAPKAEREDVVIYH